MVTYFSLLIISVEIMFSEVRVKACQVFLGCIFLLEQRRNKFMKKIPKDSEASNVLVGEVDFLDQPFIAFVRLVQSAMLGGVTEVPVPTR